MKIFGNSELPNEWFLENVASKPKAIVFITIATLLLGLALEWKFGFNVFSRVGSLLVCLAIYCVYLNHFVAREIDNGEYITEQTKRMGNTPEEIIKYINPELEESTRIRAAHQQAMFKEQTKEKLDKLRLVNKNIVKMELITGITGTFVWGFGDLVFKLAGC